MMRVGGRPAANEAWLRGNKPEVLPITFADGLGDDDHIILVGLQADRQIVTPFR